MAAKSYDLLASILFTFVVAGLELAGLNIGPLRIVLALPLVFALPGYALTVCLFTQSSISPVERFLFSLAGSIALTVLGGFILNLLPWGLNPFSWLVAVSITNVSLCLIGLIRRRKQVILSPPRLRLSLKLSQWILFGLALLVTIGAVVVARFGAANEPKVGYTQFWMLPGASSQSDPSTVEIGVDSQELNQISYKVQLKIRDELIREWPSITLAPNQKWETSVVLPFKETTNSDTIEAFLYRLDNPNVVYRRTVLKPGNNP